jgi:hypothetical protein
VIWDIVAYIESISQEPAPPWGVTTSADAFTIEQVPAEYIATAKPWEHTTPFSYSQPPQEKPNRSPALAQAYSLLMQHDRRDRDGLSLHELVTRQLAPYRWRPTG